MLFSFKHICLAGALSVSLLCSGCFETGKPVSTAKVAHRAAAISSHVVSAAGATVSADRRAKAATAKTVAASTASKGVDDEIEQALKASEERDYTTAALHLTKAKVGNNIVQLYLSQTLEDLRETRVDLENVKVELEGAKVQVEGLNFEVGDLQERLDKEADACAKDRIVAAQCKRWFGLGALFYGVEHMLEAGIIGALILGALVLTLVIAGYFIGGPFGGLVAKLSGKASRLLFNRNSNKDG